MKDILDSNGRSSWEVTAVGLLQSEIVGFGGWWLENLFSKTIIRQRQWFAIANNSHHADKSPETPPTDRASERNKKTRNNHLIISRLVAGGGLEPPTSGLWARQANQLLHPAMYLYSKMEFLCFASAKVWQKNETSKSATKIIQNSYKTAQPFHSSKCHNRLIFIFFV